jgi:hypothetical protein
VATVTELELVRSLARAALATLEGSKQRIDDLNVYPVPDGDTGTNMTDTVRAIVEALERSTASDRQGLAREVAHGALLGSRGNSGVILSQIVRGAVEELAQDGPVDAGRLARALRRASDIAYAQLSDPVEGTILSVIRELAEEAEARRDAALQPAELLERLVERGESALARTPDQLAVLRDAGVVDAGAAGLLELVRGIAASVKGEPLPEPRLDVAEVAGLDAVHQELSKYRYCTGFVVEGVALDAAALREDLGRLGDSLLVVGDATILKVHVHTDEPGAALARGTALGTIDKVEIANMHRQTTAREERLLGAVRDAGSPSASAVVAVAAGAGNKRLFESEGAAHVIEGGQTMNPSTADLLAAIEGTSAREVLVLPNNSNVILAAEQAASLATKPVRVIPSTSVPAGLAAIVPYDPGGGAAENESAMLEALAHVATGEVTVASRDADLNGLAVRAGSYLGLASGTPVASSPDFEEVAWAVVERLLADPRDVLTLLTGADAPELERLLGRIHERDPDLEVEVQPGGQPHYPLLLSAE